jgi:hypothetical protein
MRQRLGLQSLSAAEIMLIKHHLFLWAIFSKMISNDLNIYIYICIHIYICIYIYIRIIFELQNKILYITWTEFPGFTRISNLHRILYIYICMDMYGCYRIFELKWDLLGMVFFCDSKTGDSQSVNSNSGIRLIHGKLYRKQWWCYPKFAGFMQILLRPSLGLNKKNGH